MKFSQFQFVRVFAIQPGTSGEFVPPERIDPNAVGELNADGTRWLGRDSNHLAIVAAIAK